MAECTDRERAYLTALFAPPGECGDIMMLRAAVVAERVTPNLRDTCVRAWARSIRAHDAREQAWDALGLPGGRDIEAIYDEIRAEAEALAGSDAEL